MKILFYINTINYGGAERVITNLANFFSKEDNEVIFVTTFPEKKEYELVEEVNRINLENQNANTNVIKKNFSRIMKLRRICIQYKPDIVISFMAEPNFRAILATRSLGIKTLISVRNDPNKEYPTPIHKFLARCLYSLSDGCVFQTKDAQKWFPTRIQENSRIILNQVDKKFYDVNYNGKRQNIITVGRLVEQKNHKLLISAYKRISDVFPEEKLIIFGDGHLKEELIDYTKSIGLQEQVIFAGQSNKVYQDIKSAKVFVLSSDYEGMPNALMEAMALGIPVVSTDCPCGGPKDLIQSEVEGLLVEVGDIKGLELAMEKILNNNGFAEELSRNTRKKAQKFHSEKVSLQWKNYIKEIINV